MAAKKRYHAESSRRTKHMQENGMLRNDESQVANLPQNVIYRSYASGHDGMPDSWYNDTISGIDSQMDKDDSQARKFMSPKKY